MLETQFLPGDMLLALRSTWRISGAHPAKQDPTWCHSNTNFIGFFVSPAPGYILVRGLVVAHGDSMPGFRLGEFKLPRARAQITPGVK